MWPLYFSLIVIAVIAIIFLIVFFARKRRQKPKIVNNSSTLPIDEPVEDVIDNFRNGDAKADKKEWQLKICDLNRPNKDWTFSLAISDELLIGRADHCKIHLSDSSVSREHCKIHVQQNGVYISDLNATNRTIHNGVEVYSTLQIQSGDILKIGREVLSVEFVQRLEDVRRDKFTNRFADDNGEGMTSAIF